MEFSKKKSCSNSLLCQTYTLTKHLYFAYFFAINWYLIIEQNFHKNYYIHQYCISHTQPSSRQTTNLAYSWHKTQVLTRDINSLMEMQLNYNILFVHLWSPRINGSLTNSINIYINNFMGTHGPSFNKMTEHT